MEVNIAPGVTLSPGLVRDQRDTHCYVNDLSPEHRRRFVGDSSTCPKTQSTEGMGRRWSRGSWSILYSNDKAGEEAGVRHLGE